MLTLYGADLSSPSNKIRFTANALGLEYTYKPVKLREGENRSEWFLKLNPTGKIPVIDDNGFVLFESNAICKYLLEKNNSALYPKDLKQRAVVDQWSDFVSMHVGMALSKVLYNRVFAPIIKVPVDEQSIKDGLNFLEKFLPVLESQLGKNKYLAGAQMTFADINLLATLDAAEVADVDLSKYANTVKWRNELKTQAFYTKCYKDYGENFKNFAASTK